MAPQSGRCARGNPDACTATRAAADARRAVVTALRPTTDRRRLGSCERVRTARRSAEPSSGQRLRFRNRRGETTPAARCFRQRRLRWNRAGDGARSGGSRVRAARLVGRPHAPGARRSLLVRASGLSGARQAPARRVDGADDGAGRRGYGGRLVAQVARGQRRGRHRARVRGSRARRRSPQRRQ